MKRYLYCYNTIVSFSEPVGNHEFLIRCQPVLGEYMNVEEEHLVLPPDYWKHHGTDTFRNRIVYGGNRELHRSLAYVSTGIVSMQTYRIHSDSLPISIWLQPTHLTSLHTLTTNLPMADMGCMEKAESIMHHVNSILTYEPLSTDMETTAQDVIDSGKGVLFQRVMSADSLRAQVRLTHGLRCSMHSKVTGSVSIQPTTTVSTSAM